VSSHKRNSAPCLPSHMIQPRVRQFSNVLIVGPALTHKVPGPCHDVEPCPDKRADDNDLLDRFGWKSSADLKSGVSGSFISMV
jgi:hypothetical protein